MPSALRDQINFYATFQAEVASRQNERFNQDEDKLIEIRRMVIQEQNRLEKMAWACDRLKQETVRRLSSLPSTDDLNKYESQLKRYITKRLLKQGVTSGSKIGCLEGHDDNTDDNDDEMERQYRIMRDQIEDRHKELKQRSDLFSSLQDSSVIVGFHQTNLGRRYNKDELIIDFEQTQKFPAGLFIACSMLQEVFVDTIINHSSQENYNYDLDREVSGYDCRLDDTLPIDNNSYCNGNGVNICPANKPLILSESNNSLISNSRTWKDGTFSELDQACEQDLIVDSPDGVTNNLFSSPCENTSEKSQIYGDKNMSNSSSSGTYKTASASSPLLSLSSATSSLSGSRVNTPCPTSLNNDQTVNGFFGAIPKAPGNDSSATVKSTTWSEISKLNCPVRDSPVYQILPRPEKIVAETNRPHCFMDISVKGQKTARVVIRVRPDKAPLMSENFIQLCTGKRGYGYKGSKFIRCKADDHVVAGDIENNDGTGGRSIYGDEQPTPGSSSNSLLTSSSASASKCFLAEQCGLRDHKGAVRMRGMERTMEGRCKVGSQFMVWVGDIEYKEYKYTLVFGEVTQGLKYLQEISRIGMFCNETTWLLKEDVVITNSGVL